MRSSLSDAAARHAILMVRERVGIAISASDLPATSDQGCVLIPVDGHPNESFAAHFRIRWRSVETVFVPAAFSAPLIAQLGRSPEEGRRIFSQFAQSLASHQVAVFMRINGMEADPGDPASWPKDWRLLEFSLRRFAVSEELDDRALSLLVSILVVPMFSMLAALIGVEEIEIPGETEGRAIITVGTRYERKKVNRELCIQLKGCRCSVCGFDFEVFYGDLGRGFIEVHHGVPVSSMGAGYVLDIRKDLHPLCANCHAMAHREEPPVELERLKALVASRREFETKC